MNKSDLIELAASSTGVTKTVAKDVIDSVISNVTHQLKVGGEVSIVGFGTFGVAHREARTGRNPRTGAEAPIPARNAPTFKASKALKDALN